MATIPVTTCNKEGVEKEHMESRHNLPQRERKRIRHQTSFSRDASLPPDLLANLISFRMKKPTSIATMEKNVGVPAPLPKTKAMVMKTTRPDKLEPLTKPAASSESVTISSERSRKRSASSSLWSEDLLQEEPCIWDHDEGTTPTRKQNPLTRGKQTVSAPSSPEAMEQLHEQEQIIEAFHEQNVKMHHANEAKIEKLDLKKNNLIAQRELQTIPNETHEVIALIEKERQKDRSTAALNDLKVKRRPLQSKDPRLEQRMEDLERHEREKTGSFTRSRIRGNMQQKRKDEDINIEKECDHDRRYDRRRRDGRESRHRRNSSHDHDNNYSNKQWRRV
ncbi:hypothetical protein COOONC_00555 [Cooperia oncophora]